MKNCLREGRRFYGWLAGLGAAYAVYFIAQYPWSCGDFQSYETHCILRPPLYPLVVDCFKLIFGGGFQIPLEIFQVSALLAAAFAVTVVIDYLYKPGRIALLLFFACLAYNPLYFTGNILIADTLTQAVNVLFLGAAAMALRGRTASGFAWLSALAAAAVLLRVQMIFLYAPLALLIFIVYRQTKDRRLPVKAALYMAASLSLALLAHCSYNYFVNGFFTRGKTCGYYVPYHMLHLSDMDDLPVFSGWPEYPAIKDIYEKMERRKLFSKYRFAVDRTRSQYDEDNISEMTDIGVGTLYQRISKYPGEEFSDGDIKDNAAWLSVAGAGGRIFLALLRLHWREYARLVASRIRDEIVPFKIACLALLIPPLINPEEEVVFISFLTFLNFSGVFLIGLASHFDGGRYLIYCWSAQYGALSLVFGRTIKSLTRRDSRIGTAAKML